MMEQTIIPLPDNAVYVSESLLGHHGRIKSEIEAWCEQTFGRSYDLEDHVYSTFSFLSFCDDGRTYEVAISAKILHFDTATEMLAFRLRWL